MNANHAATNVTSTEPNLGRTSVFALPEEPNTGWVAFCRGGFKLLSNVWATTRFADASVTQYAEELMLEDTRRGITSMALLSLLIQVAAIALYQKLGVDGSFLYTYGLLAVLSIHIIVSVRFVSDISALNLLGTILLVATGVAIMTIAHRTGSLNAGLLSSIVLLFMVMPLVPWGLREASIIVGLTYVTFTFSFLSVEGRFDAETLWTVQFMIFASAATATLTIIRNTIVRKDDILARFELEEAHRELQLVSTRDPLTGAWNRRFLEQNFEDYAKQCFDTGETIHFAVLDIDRFKYVNDTYGHQHGDLILQHLARVFIDTLPGNTFLIRLGGDEFAVLYSGSGIDQLVERCLNHLSTDPIILAQSNGEAVKVSVGLATSPVGAPAVLTELYQLADEALYVAKSAKDQSAGDKHRLIGDLARTGTMRVTK